MRAGMRLQAAAWGGGFAAGMGGPPPPAAPASLPPASPTALQGLPNWSILTLAAHPVALRIDNCGVVPAIGASSAAKTQDERKKMSGEGILVVDIANEDTSVQPEKYYLAADGAGRALLLAGSEVGAEARVLGPVLFVCRPPSRDSPANTTSELMSV